MEVDLAQLAVDSVAPSATIQKEVVGGTSGGCHKCGGSPHVSGWLEQELVIILVCHRQGFGQSRRKHPV